MQLHVSKFLILLTCRKHSIFIIQDTFIHLSAFVDVVTISDHLTHFRLPLVFNSVVMNSRGLYKLQLCSPSPCAH